MSTMLGQFDLPTPFQELCTLCRIPGNGLFLKGTPHEAQLRALRKALEGGTKEEIAAAAGDEVVVDGFRSVRLCDWDFDGLIRFMHFVRREVGYCSAGIADLEKRRARIQELMKPDNLK